MSQRACLVGLAMWVCVWGAACDRTHQTGAMAALDEMYKTGVLTKEEYDAKKAMLDRSSTALAALDNAMKAGILTKEEYQAKRAALLTSGSIGDGAATPAVPGVTGAPAPAVAGAANSPAATPTTAAPATPPPPPQPHPAVAMPMTQAAAPATQAPPPVAATQTAQSTAPTATTRPPAPRGNFLVLKKAVVLDQNGFERPIPSSTLFVPSDWQFQGATQWNIKDSCNTYQTTVRTSGSDGRGIEILPSYSWVWADDPTPLRVAYQQKAQYGTKGCDVTPPMSAGDFLRRNLPRLRPNARLVNMEPMPDIMQQLQRQARQTEQMAAQYGLRQQVRPDVARARVRYTVNGQAVEEWLVATTTIIGTLGPSMNMRTGQLTQAFSYNCSATLATARAPEGQLDSSEKLFRMILGTFRVDQAWQNRVNGVAANVQAAEQKGIRDRVAIQTKTANDINEIRRQGFENQQRSQDRVFANLSDANRGIEAFRNPTNGETFELSNLYGHAWVNDRNEVILSDQEGFDPNVALKGNWTTLQPVKR